MAAVTFYVDVSTGSDNNSGTSTGSPVTGTAATRSGAVYTLDGSPDLSGVVANQDCIRINGETSGRGTTGDLFEITAVDDGADTVTVSPTPTGGTSGLTWYIGGQFASIDRAFDSVELNTSDVVYVKASAQYNEDCTLHVAGNTTAYTVFEGYTTTPGDGGIVDWTATTSCITGTINTTYYWFRNFKFNGCSSYGVNASTFDSMMWSNCQFTNNGNSGIICDNGHTFYRCIFDNNNPRGVDGDLTNSFGWCVAFNNSQHQLYTIGGDYFVNNLVYGPSNTNYPAINGNNKWYLFNTVASDLDYTGKTTAAVDNDSNGEYALFMFNILEGFPNGFYYGTTTMRNNSIWGYNRFDTGMVKYWTGSGTTERDGEHIHVGIGDVQESANPFVDEANDDYTLTDTTGALDIGPDLPTP